VLRRYVLAVLSIGLAATGCGGSSGGPSARATPSVTATATALTQPRAQQLADAGVLRTSDLPGYSAKPESHTSSDVADENTGRACVGLSVPAHYMARNFGMAFSKGTTEVDSSADVAVSVSQADGELAALTSSKAPACLKQGIKPALAQDGLTVTSVSVVPASVRLAGADSTFAYSYDVDATGQGHQVRLLGYEIGALVGQVEVDLTVTGVAPLAVTFADAQRLTAMATTRVKAAEQGT